VEGHVQMHKICLITATKNRSSNLKRVVRFILDQTYDNYIHLIYNNSTTPLRLNNNLSGEKFIIVNNFANLVSKKPYTTLGEIYNDAIKFVPEDVKLITFADDDDIYLENHVEEGVKGYLRGRKKAYKPRKSYYKQKGGRVSLVDNILEPSIFVEADHVKKYGFGVENVAQHHQWLNPLIVNKEIFVDDGKPTYICDWSQDISTFKTSGNPMNPDNFKNYEKYSTDVGDGIITPCSKTWADYYRKIK
jgi:glycosyltransferase involved in cell wall biosynthesis